ncbi:MAG: tetratricopeptide repeat protein, partial [Cyanobacteria bacterium J06641_5]
PSFNALLEQYRQRFGDRTHILFPHIGLRCLERLQQLSQQGLVLLTADKGEHHLSNLGDRLAPQLVTHGSFSLTVNYHAFENYCHSSGGLALFPRHQQASLDIGCLFFLNEADNYSETIDAYDRFVSDYGPDDYFSLKKLFEANLRTLSDRDILSIIRLSNYDARIFQQMLPRLFEIVSDITEDQRWNLYLAVPRIWDTYYPLGESEDLAKNLGDLLLAMAFYQEAILHYEKSIAIYGKVADTIYRITICNYELGKFSIALELLEDLLHDEPDNAAFQQLKQAIEDENTPTECS